MSYITKSLSSIIINLFSFKPYLFRENIFRGKKYTRFILRAIISTILFWHQKTHFIDLDNHFLHKFIGNFRCAAICAE